MARRPTVGRIYIGLALVATTACTGGTGAAMDASRGDGMGDVQHDVTPVLDVTAGLDVATADVPTDHPATTDVATDEGPSTADVPGDMGTVSRSAGCGHAVTATGYTAGHSMTLGSVTRTYDEYVPTTYDPNLPHRLLFVLHGLNNNGAGIRADLNFESWPGNTPNESTVIVYPDAVQSGNHGFNVDDGNTATNVDLQYFDALVANAEATRCIDTHRVFVTGFSQGGYMSNLLGCVRPTVVRAFVAQSGGFGNYGRAGHCPTGPVPGGFIVGLSDTLTLGDTRLARDMWWRPQDGCGSASTRTHPLPPSPCVEYQGCADPIVSCEIPGMPHQVWSNAREVVWDFFTRF